VVDARPVGVGDERRPRLAHVGEPVVRDVEQFDAHEPIPIDGREQRPLTVDPSRERDGDSDVLQSDGSLATRTVLAGRLADVRQRLPDLLLLTS
jgi:hypothetical protein